MNTTEREQIILINLNLLIYDKRYEELALESLSAFHGNLFRYESSQSPGHRKLKLLRRDPSTITVVPVTPAAGLVTGDDCSNPIVISVPSALPYKNTNSTCGHSNDSSLSSIGGMDSYTTGEDIIYKLNVTENTVVDLTMNPLGTNYTGMGVFEGVPGEGTCLFTAYNHGTANNQLTNVLLRAGNEYYVMIDSYASPECIRH